MPPSRGSWHTRTCALGLPIDRNSRRNIGFRMYSSLRKSSGMMRTFIRRPSSSPELSSVNAIASSIQPEACSDPNPWDCLNSSARGNSAIRRMTASSVSCRRQTTEVFSKVSSPTHGQKVGRMCGGHHSDVLLCSLAFDQVEQKPHPRRMDAVVDLLEDVETRRIPAKKRRQHGEEAECAVGSQRMPTRFLSFVSRKTSWIRPVV